MLNIKIRLLNESGREIIGGKLRRWENDSPIHEPRKHRVQIKGKSVLFGYGLRDVLDTQLMVYFLKKQVSAVKKPLLP
jgi:hypothetical protein